MMEQERMPEKEEASEKAAVIMAHILDKKSFCRMSGLTAEALETNQGISWLRSKRIYLCEEV